MVARITFPGSISRALNYNEKKVQHQKAKCLYAHNYLNDVSDLTFNDKIQRFQSLMHLNQRAKTNTIHISLNFDPSEKYNPEKLVAIAESYMRKIGFDSQPYLVYEHHDAGHPHIHIVSTNIKTNGKRIPTHNIGKDVSSKARREVEREFSLVKAGKDGQTQQLSPPVIPVRINYGKSELKRSITNVLDYVLPHYKYASLPELNAILRQYNLTADRGGSSSTSFLKGGLVYRAIDLAGNKIGVPVKASGIYSKPTLKNLEARFSENAVKKNDYKKQIKSSIDWILLKKPVGILAFRTELEKEKISLIIRQNDKGQIFGLTYIDHSSKCVFNGSEIGKEYSAKNILTRLGEPDQFETTKSKSQALQKDIASHNHTKSEERNQTQEIDLLDTVLKPSEEFTSIPYHLRRKRKKGINHSSK